MKYVAKVCILLSVFAGGATIAEPITWNNHSGSAFGSRNSVEPENQFKYKGYTGTQYKYDLNNPVDRVRYDTDPVGKLMDDTNPLVNIDRGLGQYGGGSKY